MFRSSLTRNTSLFTKSPYRADDTELSTWEARVVANGGTFGGSSTATAATLLDQLKVTSYYSKILYLLPLLGSNLAAAIVPLRDTLSVGAATNTSFVDADFSEATGLKGNGSSKILDLKIKCSQLSASGNGGLGYWENNIDFTGSSEAPIGTYNTAQTERYVLDFRNTLRAFRWGSSPAWASQASAAVNGHYYGQRASGTDQQLYLNGSSVASNSTTNVITGIADRDILLMGTWEAANVFWKGRCAVAYLTDGTLSGSEITALHTLLNTYLITPTGR